MTLTPEEINELADILEANDGGQELRAKLRQAASELSALQKEIAELKDSHQADRVDLLSMINSLRTQNRELEEENENLSSELALRIGDKLEITTLGKQNRKLREMCKVKDEALEFLRIISDGLGHASATRRCEQALALQPEK